MTPDEQQARSRKYAANCAVLRLTSGNFALFAPHDNETGMDLIAIATWAELESLVPSIEDLTYQPPTITPANLLAMLGLAKPETPIKRRSL